MQKVLFFIQIVLMGYILFPILIVCVCAQKSINNGISINQTRIDSKSSSMVKMKEIYYGMEQSVMIWIVLKIFETLINAP